MNTSYRPVWTLWLLLLVTWPALGAVDPASTTPAAPIPLAELGQRADAQQAPPAPVLSRSCKINNPLQINGMSV